MDINDYDIAECGDCDRSWHGPNAHEVGVYHAAETGHTVWFNNAL